MVGKCPLRYLSLALVFFTLIASFGRFRVLGDEASGGKMEEAVDDGPVIGIDLGTTFSCVGIYTKGRVEIITNEQGNRITPSYVAFEDGERQVGEAAKNQATINPTQTIFDAKRLIGRKFNDPTVQSDMKHVPYKVVSKDGNAAIEVNVDGKPHVFMPEEISAAVLTKMKDIAERHLGRKITRAVVTVPAYFNDSQRKATITAGKIAGLTVERIINEPTAAAIAFGLDKKSDKERNVLVYDLGGGTFDVSLLSIDQGVFEVVATSGDTHLGGEDFDQNVMEYLIRRTPTETAAAIRKNKVALQKLRKETEKAKRALSSQMEVEIVVEDLLADFHFKETLTRSKFEELNNKLFRKTLEPVKKVLEDAKMEKEDVDEIVLVGGSTRIPKVQQLLSDFFDGKVIKPKVNPDEAVAYGAAIQGAILGGHADDQEIVLLDVTPLSYGIETAGGVMTPLITRNTIVPVRKSSVFSTYQHNQTSVKIQVLQGERTMTRDNHLLGSFELSGIAPAPKGVPQIEVTFEIDADGVLAVTASDKGTGHEKSITITRDNQAKPEQVEEMIKNAALFEEADKLARERHEARQTLDNYISSLQESLKQEAVSEKIGDDDKETIHQLASEARQWFDENPDAETSEFTAKQAELEESFAPILQKIYGQAHSSAGDDFDHDEL